MPKTKRIAHATAEQINASHNKLVQKVRDSIISFFRYSSKGTYLFNEQHARTSEQDWENHYLKGIEVHSNSKPKPSLSIVITDGEDIETPIEDWNSFDDLLWILGELEAKRYQ
jgi:hypothetical protein